MSSEEQEFLTIMAGVAALNEAWVSGRSKAMGQNVADTAKKHLVKAGQKLLLRPRFEVLCHVYADGHREIEIIPLNGQATRMLQRYEQLFIENELNKG